MLSNTKVNKNIKIFFLLTYFFLNRKKHSPLGKYRRTKNDFKNPRIKLIKIWKSLGKKYWSCHCSCCFVTFSCCCCYICCDILLLLLLLLFRQSRTASWCFLQGSKRRWFRQTERKTKFWILDSELIFVYCSNYSRQRLMWSLWARLIRIQ